MRTLLFALLLFPAGGCALGDLFPEPVPRQEDIAVSWRAGRHNGEDVRRVAVLPFMNLSPHEEAARRAEDALVTELRKRRVFELVQVGAGALTEREEQDFFRTGTIRNTTLLRMNETYNAGAVLYGVVTHYRPYEPLMVGLRVELVSAGDGRVLWAADGLFDAGDERVVDDVHNYHATKQAPSGKLEGWRSILVSPTRFTTYAASRMAEEY